MEDQTKAAEVARRIMYEAAAHECDLLKDDADCRVSALAAHNQVQERGNIQTLVATVNATYELTGPGAPSAKR